MSRCQHYDDWKAYDHRLVLLSPTTDAKMSRSALEAHLTLTGWMPLAWGTGGMIKGDLIVYCFNAQPYGDLRVATTEYGRDQARVNKRLLDMWFMPDEFFWPIARKAMEIEACEHETIGIGGIPMRCTACSQLVER